MSHPATLRVIDQTGEVIGSKTTDRPYTHAVCVLRTPEVAKLSRGPCAIVLSWHESESAAEKSMRTYPPARYWRKLGSELWVAKAGAV